MTAPRYTADQLHAMSGRELDAVVAEVVMGWKLDSTYEQWHDFSDWDGFGLVIDRMEALNFGAALGTRQAGAWDAHFVKDYQTYCAIGTSLPRATAIAAVLAVQGAFHV